LPDPGLHQHVEATTGEGHDRGRQSQTFEAASGGEPEVDVAVVRARQGRYLEASSAGKPLLDIVVIRGRQHQFLQAAMASMVVEAGSP